MWLSKWKWENNFALLFCIWKQLAECSSYFVDSQFGIEKFSSILSLLPSTLWRQVAGSSNGIQQILNTCLNLSKMIKRALTGIKGRGDIATCIYQLGKSKSKRKHKSYSIPPPRLVNRSNWKGGLRKNSLVCSSMGSQLARMLQVKYGKGPKAWNLVDLAVSTNSAG